jgi:hypothetical protein
VGILAEETKVKSNITLDVSLELFLNSANVGFLTGKAIEQLVEKGCNPLLSPSESILNALYYLIGELEENHSHEKEQWLNSPIIQYISSLNDKKPK